MNGVIHGNMPFDCFDSVYKDKLCLPDTNTTHMLQQQSFLNIYIRYDDKTYENELKTKVELTLHCRTV